VIASLPVFIVLVGYHRWRRICLLAFVAQLPACLARPGTRKAGPWLEAHYYSVGFAVFFVSLWLRLVLWVHQPFSILVVAAATLCLVRRLPRTHQAFAEETLARNIVRHWEWIDVDQPRDLREAFLIHTVRTRESQRSAASILDGYKHAVRVALPDGFVTWEEVQQLQALRHQLDITPADQERLMAELTAEEGDGRSAPAWPDSAAERLPRDTSSRVRDGTPHRPGS
jgi:hypothetical protein